MKEKLIAPLLISVFVLGVLLYLFCTFMTLDEDGILKETIKAYENVQFEKEPFLKKEKIQYLTEFLLRNVDEIKNYNRHKEFKKIRLSEGAWTSQYSNDSDCFVMPTFDSTFIKEYIPPELVDSFIYYSKELSQDLIVGLSVCSKIHSKNIDSTKGSVSFFLKCGKKDGTNVNYYLAQEITKNLKFIENKTLNSIYDSGLTKDTVLFNEFKYVIYITPYSGF